MNTAELTEYLETYYEMVAGIEYAMRAHDEAGTRTTVSDRYEQQGTGAKYELAKEWTDEFQQKYAGVKWGEDLEWFETVEAFIAGKLTGESGRIPIEN